MNRFNTDNYIWLVLGLIYVLFALGVKIGKFGLMVLGCALLAEFHFSLGILGAFIMIIDFAMRAMSADFGSLIEEIIDNL